MKIQHLAAAAAITLSLTACDNASTEWHADTNKGECLAISHEHNYIARVSPQGIRILSLIQMKGPARAASTIPGCPAHDGHFATVATSVKIDGTTYPALMLCHNGIHQYQSFQLGEPLSQGEHSSRTVSAGAVGSFSSLFGTEVNLGNETAHFGKGNFSDTCASYLPHADKTVSNEKHRSILSSLFGQHTEVKSVKERTEDNLRAKGYVRNHLGQWIHGIDTINHDAGSEDVPDMSIFGIEGLHTVLPHNAGIDDYPESDEQNTAPDLGTDNSRIHFNDLQIKIDPPSNQPPHSTEGGKVNPAPGTELGILKSAAMTPEAEAAALKNAQSTYLVYHPGTNISAFTWQKSPLPDKSVNGATVHMLRFTTTSPQTNVTTDVDVEINPDGSAGYATSNDRPTPVATNASVDPVNAYCTLDNGKNVNVYAANGQDYRYSYLDKNNQSELELTEGLFGVKAFHYETQLGMGKAQYIRFNKKQYDYVLLSLDTGKREFYGIRVYKDGSLISSHACKTRLNLDVSPLTDAAHADSGKMGDFVTN